LAKKKQTLLENYVCVFLFKTCDFLQGFSYKLEYRRSFIRIKTRCCQ